MEIKITKSARACAGCERDFIHDEQIFSLVRVADQEFFRADFCQSCWNPQEADGAYSHWSTKFYDAQVADQQPPEVFSPLRQLFYEAQEAEDRLDHCRAFLAAQLLRRQKVFKLVKESDESDGETKILLFIDRIGNRLIEVRDPNFSYSEMDQARTGLVQRLQELEATQPAEESSGHAQSPQKQAN